jgi:uncharacterized membrane protein YphA (DoxX/SURF4 family)
MNALTNISRLVVGSLFIVSGLIKANDPVGFSYKLKDYFAPDVLNLEFLVPLVLPMAVLICAVEIILGVAALFGSKMKLVSWMLLLMIVFFTFLTFYSAYFEKVTDCGCFGDALKLTPWQSFTKDVVLLFFVLVIFLKKGAIAVNTGKEDLLLLPASMVLIAVFSYGVISWGFPVYFALLVFAVIWYLKNREALRKKITLIAFGVPALASLLFSAHVLMHLPIRDFRPYAIGKSIPEQMTLPEGAPVDVYENIWLYKDAAGTTNKYTDDDKPWEDSTLAYVDRETILVIEGDEPPIHDFSISSMEGEDFTEMFITDPGYVFILIAHDITNQTNVSVSKKVNQLAAESIANGMQFIGLTSSLYESVEQFRHDVQAGYDYYLTDEKTLQTILRSNPGLMLIHNGVIIGKWHYNDITAYAEIEKLVSSS